MAFNKNKKIVTTALTAAMVASAVAPVAAATKTVTPAQAATKAVDAYYKLSVKTRADVSNSAKVKEVALKAIAKLGKKDAKLKASLTAKVAKKSAAINKYYKTVIVPAETEAKNIATAKAALEAAKAFVPTAETKVEDVEKMFTDGMALINKIKTASVKAELTKQAEELKAAVLKKIEELKVAKVEKVTVVNTKSIKVEFNAAIDTKDVTFSVKRGTAVVVLDATFAEDKKSATLSSPVALTAGDYTITANGGKFVAGTNVGTVKVEAEKETSLTITSETVSKSNAGVIAFEVKNQYGEVMDIKGSAVSSTAYDRTAKADGSGTGAVTLNGSVTKSELTGDFSPATVANNDEILVTVSYKALTASKVVKAQDLGALSSLQLVGAVPNTNETRITTGQTVELKYNAIDQYNKEFKLAAYTDATADDKAVIGDFQVTSSNKDVVDADTIAVDANGKMTITAGSVAGTAKLVVVNVKTGTASSVDVTVVAPTAADAITLTAPSTLVAVDETVKVPYTVVNQFGETITPANLTTSQVTLASSNNSVATVAWVGKEIVVTGKGSGTAEISATIGTKVVKFSVDIQAKAVPTKVVGIKDVASLYENTATSTLDFSKISVKDQYGRNYTLKDNDVVTVTAKDGTANGVGNTLTDNGGTTAFDHTSDVVTFDGKADTSNEVYTIAINGVTGSGYDVTLASVASTAVTSYELKSVGTLYGKAGTTEASAHAAGLTLVGKNAEGKEVALVANKITNLTTSDSTIVDVDFASKKVFALAKGEATITAWNGAIKLATLTVTASDVAPRLTTISFENATVTKLAADANFTNVLTLKDQYGVAIVDAGTFSSSNATVATVTAAGLVDVLAAGTTTIGYVSTNGQVATYTLTVQ